jgi:TonB-linked SusC/RagA family outer membrane protein
MRKLRMLLALSLLGLVSLVAMAQNNAITGRITDEKGDPVPFATITIKDTKRSVVADKNGNFSVAAVRGTILLISATGFGVREIAVHDNGYTYTLSTRNDLQEVVVTALGIRRSKNSLPYATQQVSGEEINRTPTTNFVDNLSGKVAGLQITSSNTTDGTNNVILRGLKSLTQSNQALFVVDGVPYDNTNESQNGFDLGNAAADINPEDIESVSVLKGAAASALYGSRASNGVILINTKKGSHKGKAVGVTVSSGVTVGTPDKSTLPTYQTQYGEGYGSQGYSSTYPAQSGFFYYVPTFTSNGAPVQVVQTDVDAATGPAYDPSLKVYNWDAFAPGDPNYGKATAWQAAAHHNPTDFFVTPTTTINSVYTDWGGDDGTFKAGYTHSVDKGLLPNNVVTKNLFTLGATHNFTNQVTVGGTLNYSDAAGVGRDGYTYSSQQNPLMDFREWWPTNVNLHQQKADYFYAHNNESWNWLGNYADPSTLIPAYHNNIYWNRYQNSEDDERKRYFGNVYINYKITPFLNLLGRVSLDDYTQFTEYWTAIGSVHQAAYTRSNASYNETNYDLLLNFDKKLSNDFTLKALLGSNVRQNTNSSILATTSGGLVVPGLYTLANSVQTPAAPSEYLGRKEVDGIFAGATLSYRDFITLDATLRRDRSSTLPSANDAYYYPSVSGNFVFSKLLNLPWLSNAKLRANYAEVGGDAPLHSVQNTFQNVNPLNGETLFAAPVVNNNQHLVPEENKSYEVGLEASFLNSRIGFDVTYYHAREINQIMPVNVSNASGYSQFFVNGGAVQNQGVELTVNATPVSTRDFSWNITVNWSKNVNKILSLYSGQGAYEIASYGFNTQLVAEVGKSYGIIRGSDYQYKNGQRLIDSNGYYAKNSNPLSDIGNTNPDWYGGITNSLRYKDWTFSFLVDVRQGGKVYSLDMDFGDYSGLYPETAGKNNLGNPVRSSLSSGGGLLLKGVTSDGKPNTKLIDASDINQGLFPFSSYNNFADASYVYDASYVKLREVALTYSIPKKALAGLSFVKGIDIALTGRNLWIIHKNLPYADPEQGYASLGSGTGVQNASQGFQVGVYPSVRTFGLTAKLKF